MQPGGLVKRMRSIPDLRRSPLLDAFDPGNDLHVDEAARVLLERFRRKNDAEAFTILFELTHERLHEIASQISRRLSPSADPDDLASAFMARLFSEGTGNQQQPVRRFLALAHTSMRNSVFDHLRQQQRARKGSQRYHDSLDEPADPAVAAANQEEASLLKDCGQRLVSLTDDCFHQLDPRDKNVLVAREILGMSYERVAAMLDLETKQVGMIIRRARQHLADRLVDRLGELPLSGGAREQANALVLDYLQSKQGAKSVRTLVQRMLDAAVSAGHRRLSDLVYEMAKSCLVAVPEFEQRMLVHAAPRRRDQVAEDVRDLGARLAAIDHPSQEADAVVDVARHTLSRQAALDDGSACLQALERLEGRSGRQQVAVALHEIHIGSLPDAETRLRDLMDADIPAITRQNVFRNLMLVLLRQEHWQDALEVAETAEADWPDDPVRIMNVCYATARLGDAEGFENHVRRLVAIQAREQRPRVSAWIQEDLPRLADALGLSKGHLNTVIDSARSVTATERDNNDD